jgi:hypothetical protein
MVIGLKRALRRWPRVAAHVPSDRRLGNLEAELEQLTMNTRRAPMPQTFVSATPLPEGSRRSAATPCGTRTKEGKCLLLVAPLLCPWLDRRTDRALLNEDAADLL